MWRVPHLLPSQALLSLFYTAQIHFVFICSCWVSLFVLGLVGQPWRQCPNFLQTEHWFLARPLCVIQGDLDVFTVANVGCALCSVFRFARLFFARLRFLFFFRFFAPLLSEDVSEEELEDEDEPSTVDITAAARFMLLLSSLTFEFFATMMWSSTALQTSWSSHALALDLLNSIARRMYSSSSLPFSNLNPTSITLKNHSKTRINCLRSGACLRTLNIRMPATAGGRSVRVTSTLYPIALKIFLKLNGPALWGAVSYRWKFSRFSFGVTLAATFSSLSVV